MSIPGFLYLVLCVCVYVFKYELVLTKGVGTELTNDLTIL